MKHNFGFKLLTCSKVVYSLEKIQREMTKFQSSSDKSCLRVKNVQYTSATPLLIARLIILVSANRTGAMKYFFSRSKNRQFYITSTYSNILKSKIFFLQLEVVFLVYNFQIQIAQARVDLKLEVK